MCTVPKHLLDDIESHFPPRTKSGMLKALATALNTGRYPGWEQQREAATARMKNPPDGPPKPKPLINSKGVISASRQAHATSGLGRHFITTFYDKLIGVDLHNRV
jgi:hypothetical protein